MKTLIPSIAGLALCSALVSSARAAPPPNLIQSVNVADRGEGVELQIQGNSAPSYTVFRLQDPPRLVIDLAGADVSAVSEPIAVNRGGVLGVTTTQYRDARSAVARVVVGVEQDVHYEVAQRGDAVVLRVDRGPAKAGSRPPASEAAGKEPAVAAKSVPVDAESAAASATAEPKSSEPKTIEAKPAAPPAVASAEPAKAEAIPAKTDPAEEPAAAPAQDAKPIPAATGSDNVVSRRVDEVKVKHPATALLAVRASAGRILLSTNGEVGRVEIVELRDPIRLALDLCGVLKAPKAPVRSDGPFGQVRFGKDVGKIRVVLDARDEMPRYQLRRVRGGLAVVTAAKLAAAPRPSAVPVATVSMPPPAAPAVPAAPARSAAASAERASLIHDLRFSQSSGMARVDLVGKASYTVSHPDPRTVVLTLENAQLPKRLERSLDTSAFRGPVAMVSSFNQPSVGRAVVVASLRAEAADLVAESASGLTWTFTPAGGQAKKITEDEAEGADATTQSSETQAAGFTAEAPSYALSGAPQKREYSGRRITLDFHDIEIRNLLRLIADVSKKNIVVADDVTGKVTVSLRNVPWDQALDLILKTKGLDKEEMGNVIRIAKFEQIAGEAKARAEANKARIPLLPLKVRLIPVNFARAGDLATRVKDVLSERGTVSTDDRTNVLIVKDIQEALVRAEGLVRNLDTETPQVLIESRIVEASSNFNREVGVQWGGSLNFSQSTGNPTGLSFPNIFSSSGAAGGSPNAGTSANPGYAVNLPAAIGQGSGGGIGFALGSASGAFNLNLRLSALENTGVVKTISSPKVATIDNKEATIGQGLSIPFSQTSSSGVNTTFIEAKLELKVTPHVSADGSILMKIKATNNAPNPQLTGANGQPSISKREAETEVIVKDGDTTVIGGIYTRQTSHRDTAVPWLSKIPVLGFFFRDRADQDDHTELLIFITPRILNRQSATATAGAGVSP
jgi:type IV pilus assembly protein PilQ